MADDPAGGAVAGNAAPEPGDATGDKRIVVVHRKTRVFDGFFKIDELEVTYSRLDGEGFVRNAKLLVFERGDSAAVLIHDIERDMIVLTEQFRVPTYGKGDGWLIEPVAGMMRSGETPEQCVRRESLEEVGYQLGDLTFISRVFASPGGSSERLHLFYAPVRTADLIRPEAAGEIGEHENTRRVDVPRVQFLRDCLDGRIEDAKLMVCGLWLAALGEPAA